VPDLEQAVRGADMIVTVTPSQRWLVDDAWVAPGTHIAAIGGGLSGSQELDPRILRRARIFTDDLRQCAEDGEINVPIREGLLTLGDVTGDFGAVVAGRLAGRETDEDVTVFDSTGIALQDSATVPLEYERALAAGVGVAKKMIST
jgi:ornithine cyclodeaminase/alanine dehydrogenase-like protein (mu-crystallin family)